MDHCPACHQPIAQTVYQFSPNAAACAPAVPMFYPQNAAAGQPFIGHFSPFPPGAAGGVAPLIFNVVI